MVRQPLSVPTKEAEAPLVLSVDIGTSGICALAFDARGRALFSTAVTTDHNSRTSREGEASVSADERLRALEHAVETVLARAGHRAADIAAVGVATFWHSLLGTDARGRPTTRALTWADTRARGASARLRAELDTDEVHGRTGCYIHASYLPAKLRYLRESEWDRYRRTIWWGSLGEYIYTRLFGDAGVGHGMASATGLFDQRRRGWDTQLLGHLDVNVDALSTIDDAPRVGLRPVYARRWPALARVPWLPALGDGACSNVGAGAVGHHVAALMLGTSAAVMRVLFEGMDPPVVRGGLTYRLDGRRIVAGGALSNAGNVLSWLRRTFPDVDLDAVARRPVAKHGIVALPLFAGDRSPTWNDAARGVLAGISLDTAGDDIAQAAVEGIALRVASLWELVLGALPGVSRIVATGAPPRPFRGLHNSALTPSVGRWG